MNVSTPDYHRAQVLRARAVLLRRSVRGAPDLARPLETANEPLARGYRREDGAIHAGGQPHLHLHPWRPPHDMAVVHGELLTVRQLAAVKPAMPGGSKAAEEATLGAAGSSTRGGGWACSGVACPRESKVYCAAQSCQVCVKRRNSRARALPLGAFDHAAMPVEGAHTRACTHEIAHPRAREEGAAEGAVELARDSDGAVGG